MKELAAPQPQKPFEKKNEILGLGAPEAAKPKDPGIRRISLGGIIYESSSKWTVWLNGTRITPKKLPKQAKSFVVYKDHIEMTWHDPYTEQTFPIRLRPQQTFDLDTRLFSDRTGE